MSLAWYITLDTKEPGFDTFVNGKAIAHRGRELNGLARALGVRPLDEFVSTNPEQARSFMTEHGVDASGLKLPGERWFEAAEGLATVEPMLNHLERNMAVARDLGSVQADLVGYSRVLKETQRRGYKWHLAVDF